MKVVAIISGGMDSVTMAYGLHKSGYELVMLSFDYGQRHKKEIQYARACANALKAQHEVIDLHHLTPLIGGSSLTSKDIEVPDGHYAEETMKITVVPNRNAIMLSIAFGVAVAQGADAVATAVHAGDHFIYPDCRPAFIDAFDKMEKVATEGFGQAGLHLMAPFVNITKADIVRLGVQYEVPYKFTWSCYKGGEVHCGRCGTCVERKEAFKLAEFPDPTLYVDRDYMGG